MTSFHEDHFFLQRYYRYFSLSRQFCQCEIFWSSPSSKALWPCTRLSTVSHIHHVRDLWPIEKQIALLLLRTTRNISISTKSELSVCDLLSLLHNGLIDERSKMCSLTVGSFCGNIFCTFEGRKFVRRLRLVSCLRFMRWSGNLDTCGTTGSKIKTALLVTDVNAQKLNYRRFANLELSVQTERADR